MASAPEAAGAGDPGAALARLERRAGQCMACPLAATRNSVVFGAGPVDAGVMLIGEAPGAEEDLRGEPFIGRSGRLLDSLLAEAGLQRGDLFVTNLVKCRPPGNRDPKPAEIEACSDWLGAQIDVVSPRLICTLGNHATMRLTGRRIGITRIHGRPLDATVLGRPVVLYPLFHPAAALRSKATLELLREDIRGIPALLRSGSG